VVWQIPFRICGGCVKSSLRCSSLRIFVGLLLVEFVATSF
jgi:hypothetical protein